MPRKPRTAPPAGRPALRPGQTPRSPRPGQAPARLPGASRRAGLRRNVKPLPLPGKTRGR